MLTKRAFLLNTQRERGEREAKHRASCMHIHVACLHEWFNCKLWKTLYFLIENPIIQESICIFCITEHRLIQLCNKYPFSFPKYSVKTFALQIEM